MKRVFGRPPICGSELCTALFELSAAFIVRMIRKAAEDDTKESSAFSSVGKRDRVLAMRPAISFIASFDYCTMAVIRPVGSRNDSCGMRLRCSATHRHSAPPCMCQISIPFRSATRTSRSPVACRAKGTPPAAMPK